MILTTATVGNIDTLALQMTQTGGGKGTWGLLFDVCPVLLVAEDGKVYDFDGTLINSNWDGLSNTDKVALFSNAGGNNLVSTAISLGTVRFAVLSSTTAVTVVQNFRIVAVPNNQIVTPNGFITISSYENIDQACTYRH